MVKKNNKLVSIIIRGKNESRWLKILLKELKKQTIRNYEIIFCDNNSDDNSIEILKKNRDLLDKLVDILLNQETIDKQVFKLTTSKLLKV